MLQFQFRQSQFLKPYKTLILLLIFAGFWFLLFLSSGTLFSGFHFTDDHDIVAIHHHLTAKQMNILEVMRQWLQEDHATGRFRPFYFIYRIFQTTFLGINFPFWATYNALTAVLATFLFFIFAGLLQFSLLEASLFALLTTLGPQSAIWWQLGPAETIGTLLLALSLVFTALSAAPSKFRLLYKGFAIIFAILMSLSKESYILMLPAISFLHIWLSQKICGSWLKAFKQESLYVAILLLTFCSSLLFVKYSVGTTPDINYAGVDGFRIGAIWTTFLELSTHGSGWIILLTFALLIRAQIPQNDHGKTVFLPSWKGLRYVLSSSLIPIFLFLLIAVPQSVLYAKSGISQRYLVPGIVAYSFLLIWLHHVLQSKQKNLSRLILLLIAVSLSLKLHSAWKAAHVFAMEGKSTNQLMETLITHTAPKDTLLLVTHPFVYSEWNFSIKKYLNYAADRDNLYLATYTQPSSGDIEQQLNAFYGDYTLNNISDKSNIQCIVVFPLLNDIFLRNSSSWFIREDYQEYVFGNFNRHFNTNSKINLYCKKQNK